MTYTLPVPVSMPAVAREALEAFVQPLLANGQNVRVGIADMQKGGFDEWLVTYTTSGYFLANQQPGVIDSVVRDNYEQSAVWLVDNVVGKTIYADEGVLVVAVEMPVAQVVQ